MRHFTIRTNLLPKPTARFLHEKTEGPSGQIHERICVMGQILQQLGEKTYLKTGPLKTLNELKTAIPPFTRCVRGINLQSDLAHIIMNADPHTTSGQSTISEALSKWNMTIAFEGDA